MLSESRCALVKDVGSNAHSVYTGLNPFHYFVYVSLTVHLSITLANDQLDVQIFSTFITVLYMHMFRAISCSSSGGKIALTLNLLAPTTVGARINP